MMLPSIDQAPTENVEILIDAFRSRGMLPSTFVDENCLRTLGIYDEVYGLLETVGWRKLMKLAEGTNVEDTCEFLASVVRVGNKLRYRHRGVYYQVSKKELRKALGYKFTSKDIEDEHSNDEAWGILTASEKEFRGGRSMGAEIVEPRYFYVHRLMSHSVVGRLNGANRLGLLDIKILKAMVYGTRVDFGDILMHHWTSIVPSSKSTVGGIVTYYLRKTHGQGNLAAHTVLGADFLTMAKLVSMRALKKDSDGIYVWNFQGYVEANRPLVGNEEEMDTALEAPARRQSARVRERHAWEHGESSAHGQQTWMDPEQQRRWMFNVDRAIEYCLPEFHALSIDAPPEWMPGMPVPDEYKIHRGDQDHSEDEE